MATALLDGVEKGQGSEETGPKYYDVLMVGRTGYGKSTVGNKLLGIDSDTKSILGAGQTEGNISSVIKLWDDVNDDQKPFFETDDGSESVTMTCKLLSNEKTMHRVLDTKGFTSTDRAQQYGVMKGNLEILQQILQAQRDYDLRFSRVLYFLPNRGPLERSDGNLQEEIRVMHSFFGQKIFDVMIIVATNHKSGNYQQVGFGKNDITDTQQVFKHAYKEITGCNLPKCPPVVYIPFNEDHEKIVENIIGAEVISEDKLLETKKEDGPSSDRMEPPCFETECTNCGIQTVQERLPSGEVKLLQVISSDEGEEVYDKSKCHPSFAPKHSRCKKITGGILHCILLGFGVLYELLSQNRLWPGCFNSEEVCVHCGNPRGSNGCVTIKQDIKVKGKEYRVDHKMVEQPSVEE